MKVNMPSIKISVSDKNSEYIREITYGIEEEGIPYDITEENFSDIIKKAFEISQDSRLSVGIAADSEKAVIHFSKLKMENPLFIVNLSETKKENMRIYGSNAARLIKGIPFK
jgi:hypothetical protein